MHLCIHRKTSVKSKSQEWQSRKLGWAWTVTTEFLLHVKKIFPSLLKSLLWSFLVPVVNAELLGGIDMQKGKGGTSEVCEGRRKNVWATAVVTTPGSVPSTVSPELKTTRLCFIKATKIWYQIFESSNSKPCGNFQKFNRTNRVRERIYEMSKLSNLNIYQTVFLGIVTWKWWGDTFGEAERKEEMQGQDGEKNFSVQMTSPI